MKLVTVFSIVCMFILSSCVNTRPVQYVQGQFDTAQFSKYLVKEPVIQKADLISIVVYSDDVKGVAAAPYNLANTASGASNGYLVDENGEIQFQGIGKLHVEGLTKRQLSDLLDTKLKEFLQNPYYTIRFLNYKITLLGELNREGIYTVPSERVNILEAIGLAGGLGLYARKENVLVIREVNGKREYGRIDLSSADLFNSPFYFLQQNDMVLVEQTKAKVANSDQTTARNISLATSIISTLLFVYSVFR